MSEIGDLLDRLHDWVVGYNPQGKTFRDFERELEAANAELYRLMDRAQLDAEAMESYGLIMSLADARGFLYGQDTSPDALIRPGP